MINFTPCLDIFFKPEPLPVRFAELAKLGFDRFEMWSWWDKEVDAIRAAREQHGLQLAACCTRFVPLTDPARRDEYCRGLEETVEFCRKTQCRTIISQVGNDLAGMTREEQFTSLVLGLQKAAAILSGTDLELVIEPLNILVDHQGYFLARSDEAAAILRIVASPNIKMLFDVYHQQITEGNVIANLTGYASLIGHYHLADVPGRHEPGTGELNYPNVLKAIAATGYKGNVGLEFFPSGNDHMTILKNFRQLCR